MIIQNLIVTGESNVVPFLATTAKCKWMILSAPSTNTHSVLVGGIEVSPSPLSGFPLAPGITIYLPTVSDMFELYQFAKCYCYVAAGDLLNVLYGLEGSNS
jgi:hypothetical protein